jgi:hypothetical protein
VQNRLICISSGRRLGSRQNLVETQSRLEARNINLAVPRGNPQVKQRRNSNARSHRRLESKTMSHTAFSGLVKTVWNMDFECYTAGLTVPGVPFMSLE